ncbi:ATP-dependent zinc metalloprotease FtsH [Gossypium australe]|uniref:ATP-dependent zinc metalloprotease FtsH n=1 Tax=Gossypium australe TaxID=47621 RepID=A0A5B6X1P4_9ROSI|nr:ATP-dependent zinc metalloprotease FtsH [Gossypium australe]
MDDLDFTAERKLKGVVSLLRDEAYQWWLTVKEGTQLDRLTWDYFKTVFQMAEYEAEFLRLSHYARGMVATEYERCVCFEDGLRDSLRVLIAPQREREFATLVEKAKIAEEVKRAKRQNRERGKNNRESEPSSSVMRPEKKARSDGLVRVGPPVAPIGVALCGHCGRHHPSECWRTTRACLRYGWTEHRVRDCPLRTDQKQAPITGAP